MLIALPLSLPLDTHHTKLSNVMPGEHFDGWLHWNINCQSVFLVHSRALIRAGCIPFPAHCPCWPRQGTDFHSLSLAHCFTKWDRIYRQNLTPSYTHTMTLKMEAACISETSTNLSWFTWMNNPRTELRSVINQLESQKSVIVVF